MILYDTTIGFVGKLKKCPFCKSKRHVVMEENGGRYSVSCLSCRVTMDCGATDMDSAAKAWNDRKGKR